MDIKLHAGDSVYNIGGPCLAMRAAKTDHVSKAVDSLSIVTTYYVVNIDYCIYQGFAHVSLPVWG